MDSRTILKDIVSYQNSRLKRMAILVSMAHKALYISVSGFNQFCLDSLTRRKNGSKIPSNQKPAFPRQTAEPPGYTIKRIVRCLTKPEKNAPHGTDPHRLQ